MKKHLPRSLLLLGALLCTTYARGLQDEWIASSRWGALVAEYSPLTNPALLTRANFISLRAAMSTVLKDFYVHDIGATVPVALHQSAGVTWLRLHSVLDPADVPGAQAGEKVVDKSGLLMFSYAVNPFWGLNLGLNLNIVHEEHYGKKSKTGFGADFGVCYDLLRHPRLGRHTVGVSAQNLLAPKLGTGRQLLRNLRGSWLWSVLEGRVESVLDVSFLDPFGTDEKSGFVDWAVADTGMGRWTLNEKISIGIVQQLMFHALVGVGPRGLTHAGLGVELRLPTVVSGKDRDVALAYQHLWLTESRTDNMSVFLRAELGKHRLGANVMYERAIALYNEHDFWEAFLAFGRIIAEYPNWERNDWVSYYMARCEEELHMHNTAAARYAKIREQYPHSDAIPLADMGLMNVSYRAGNYEATAHQFDRLNTERVADSLKYHAYYIMAQAHMQQGQYVEARPLLEQAPTHHPDFIFSLHSLAVANIATNRLDSAVSNLRRCLQHEPDTPAEEEMANRSRVLLGYLYYENAADFEGGLAKAARHLRKVPRESFYFGDALLGLGWTALKAGQWRDCAVAAEALAGRLHPPVLRAEGLLLKAYALYLQQSYAPAAKALEKAMKVVEEVSPHAQDSVDRSRERYEKLCRDYDALGKKAERLAMSRRRPRTRRRINSAALEQKELGRKIEKGLLLLDEQRRQRFFGRRLPALKEDIQYALASAAYMLHTKDDRAGPKDDPRHKRIDRKIEKLQKKIEKLEPGD